MDKRTKADLAKIRITEPGVIILEDLEFGYTHAEIKQATNMLRRGSSLETVAKSIRTETPPDDALYEVMLLVMHLQRKNKIQFNIEIINNSQHQYTAEAGHTPAQKEKM